jgi:hypothetical protein
MNHTNGLNKGPKLHVAGTNETLRLTKKNPIRYEDGKVVEKNKIRSFATMGFMVMGRL